MLICLYGEMRDALWPQHGGFRFHGSLCARCGFSARPLPLRRCARRVEVLRSRAAV